MTKNDSKRSVLRVIGQDEETTPAPQNGSISRRRFLQIAGAATAAGVAGCTDGSPQKIFPYVKGDDQVIPGVSVWYSSTCSECSAGCGIKVRTREGRAVKVEGNPEHPVNRGGLCALGQASLQALYDPDRIRQPLKKSGATFEAISWEDAYAQVAEWLKKAKNKAILTSELSGALEELVQNFSQAHGCEHVVWDLLQPVAQAAANETAFGRRGVPQYDFEKADTVVNFGADFLETWVSPCEYARGWAKARRSERPVRVVHIEPRLSLTGASADHWIAPKPGTEILVAAALLKILIEQGFGSEYRSSLQGFIGGLDINQLCHDSGVGLDKLTLVAEFLRQSRGSLVLAGGTVASGENGYDLSLVCNFINLVLGNVGKTINLDRTRAVKTSPDRVKALIEKLNSGGVDLLFVHDTNPVFTLPAAYNFKYAMKKAGHIVSFASHLDETSEMADLILPAHSGLESWGDQRLLEGVFSLQQPSMNPVFDTREFGDSLLTLSERAGKGLAGGSDFKSYLKESWKKVHAQSGSPLNFETFWKESLERGGFFKETPSANGRAVQPGRNFDLKIKAIQFTSEGSDSDDVAVYPYPSVKSFDGRAANRPWLQELPDPITQIVWDSWAEVNPKTAKAKGLVQGDMVTIRNFNGELNLPVYITEYVKEGMVAVPLGQGHTSYGRYAKKVGGGNVLDLLPAGESRHVALYSAKASLIRGRGRSTVVNVQGSDSQHGRELVRTKFVENAALAAAALKAAPSNNHANGSHASGEAHGGGEHGGGHGAHHEPKQMYVQRGHPQYRWGMAIDLATCTGCSACVVACYAENNIPVVGKERCSEGREMSWLRIERYYEQEAEELQVSFLPMLCQHCNNAPCEPVCPVYATYHNEEGLNAMVYNRCVGTRYCSNNCSYKVRRFNWFEYELPSPMELQLNPDVMKRVVGVMEKCTFCVQRIAAAKDSAKDLGRAVKDGEIQPACVQSCATGCMTFGDLNDPESQVSKLARDGRAYKVLDHHLNTQPAIAYLENVRYKI